MITTPVWAEITKTPWVPLWEEFDAEKVLLGEEDEDEDEDEDKDDYDDEEDRK